MFGWFGSDTSTKRSAERLYGQIVAHARREAFYAEMGVADSLQGRFEVLLVHMYLLLDRLAACEAEGHRLSRAVGERFVIDMDDNMRELGVGDLAVPRRVKKTAAALYERTELYRVSAELGDGALLAALETNLPSREDAPVDAERMLRYALAGRARLAETPLRNLVRDGFTLESP